MLLLGRAVRSFMVIHNSEFTNMLYQIYLLFKCLQFLNNVLKQKAINNILSEQFQNNILSEQVQNNILSEQFQTNILWEQFQITYCRNSSKITLPEQFQNNILSEQFQNPLQTLRKKKIYNSNTHIHNRSLHFYGICRG